MILVEHLLPSARERLETIPHDASLVEAARRLGASVDLFAVCDSEGCLIGVVTKSDVVKRIGECQGASCAAPVAAAMTSDAFCCRAGDWLHDVWSLMRENGLKNVPVIDEDDRAIGIVAARDAFEALLADVEHEESLLRDYVACVGYR